MTADLSVTLHRSYFTACELLNIGKENLCELCSLPEKDCATGSRTCPYNLSLNTLKLVAHQIINHYLPYTAYNTLIWHINHLGWEEPSNLDGWLAHLNRMVTIMEQWPSDRDFNQDDIDHLRDIRDYLASQYKIESIPAHSLYSNPKISGVSAVIEIHTAQFNNSRCTCLGDGAPCGHCQNMFMNFALAQDIPTARG
ncbi:MAG: hypothetical protein ACKOC5_10280 [Chloroflexota bacterium]